MRLCMCKLEVLASSRLLAPCRYSTFGAPPATCDRCASAWLKGKVAVATQSYFHGSGAVVPSTAP
eukprot:11552178-Alexandrium_andersonii.AAC.1